MKVWGISKNSRSKTALFAAAAIFAAPFIGVPAQAAPNINPPSAASTAADKSYRSCKTIRRCVDILERHDAESFDYNVLAADFARFGPAAREVLWRLIEPLETNNDDEEAQQLGFRALDMLSRSPVILPPKEQRRMVNLWTSQTRAPRLAPLLLRMMRTHMSPLVRSTAIKTLDHPVPEVADYSRALLSEAVRANMDFPMPDTDFAPLSRAVLSKPNPDLVALTALYPKDRAAPVLSRVLKSGDTASVIAAYDALYESDAEAAFKALIATLYGLGDQDAKAATTLGGLLAHRHPLREDGFYMKFAAELSSDSEMSPAGRAAGFDALLRRAGEKSVPKLIDSQLSAENFALAVSAFKDTEIPTPYFAFVAQVNPKNPDAYLAPLKENSTTPANRRALTQLAGQFDTPLARDIVSESFKSESDYKLKAAAIFARTAQAGQNKTALMQNLKVLSETAPLMPVRAAAKLGLDALRTSDPRKTIATTQKNWAQRGQMLTKDTRFCKINGADLRAAARSMPFYDPALLAGYVETSRAQLSSGARVKNGWLAGYEAIGTAKMTGGLVRYDNTSGVGEELFERSGLNPHSVTAVMAVTPPRLGQSASEFWVFAKNLMTPENIVYRATLDSRDNVTLKRHMILPATPLSFAQGKDGEVSFDMGRAHPPLSLLPNSTLASACEK